MVPFEISEQSLLQLKKMRARAVDARPELAVRIYMSGFGLCGPEWGLTLDTYSQDADECCDFDDIKVIIERDLLQAVGGINVQFESYESDTTTDDDDAPGGFLITALDPEVQALFSNPASGCGCGGGCGHCGGGCGGHCGDCHGHCDSCDGCDDCP